MTDAPKPSAPSAMVGRWRDRLIDGAVLAIPTALLTQSTDWVRGKFFSQPWQVLWLALPLAAAAYVCWRLLRRPDAGRLSWRFGVFLVAYGSLFAVLSSSELLVWKRAPVAEFESGGSRNWLLPVRLGDWRYWLAPKELPHEKLMVVLLDHLPYASPVQNRARDARLIAAAVQQGAKGIFFDVSFTGTSAADPVLCNAVRAATAAKIPVVVAYQVRTLPGQSFAVARPAAKAGQTPDCLIPGAGGLRLRGHSMVLADVDSIVRTIPLDWRAALDGAPLSVVIARCMQGKCDGGDLKLPESSMLHFLPTRPDPDIIRGDRNLAELLPNDVFANRFVLFGEDSPLDTFPTPMHESTPGTLIHAYGANALLSGHRITRPPAWFSAFIVIAVCAVLAMVGSQAPRPVTLLWAACVMSVLVFVLAAVAMVVSAVWLDVVYALAAMWLLVPLLLGYQRFPSLRGVPALS